MRSISLQPTDTSMRYGRNATTPPRYTRVRRRSRACATSRRTRCAPASRRTRRRTAGRATAAMRSARRARWSRRTRTTARWGARRRSVAWRTPRCSLRSGYHPRVAVDRTLERYAWLSLVAAVVTIVLKTLAWYVTDSVGLLSDALEALINLAAALLALSMLRLAATPPDARHPYGRFKAEYFASGAEGALIVFAAVSIAFAAAPRLAAPHPIDAPGLGIALSVAATAVNLGVALMLVSVGKRLGSIALEADGRHLMTDVWTSAGVVAGVVLVAATGWLILD